MKAKFLLLLLVAFSFANAQKSSPVMGDSATLIDLLKKDYSAGNPDTRDEEMDADRTKVIGIFKSYLEDKKKQAIDYKNSCDVQEKYKIYNYKKEQYKLYEKINFNLNSVDILEKVKSTNQNQVVEKTKSIEEYQTLLKTAKDNYYECKKTNDINELTKLQTEYNSYNPYLSNTIGLFLKKYESVNDNDQFAQINSNASIQKSIPFIGGDLAFETIIDGLSRFLAKRIKEELTIHAIDKIKNYLKNPTPENYCYELLAILPTTTNYLKQFEADQLLNFQDEIKQYVEQDLNDLLKNAVNLQYTPRLKSYIQKNPDLEFAFEGLEIIPQLSKIKSPIDYFELLENSRTLSKWRNNKDEIIKYNIAQSFRLASMLAYSMTLVENGETKFASVDFVSNYGNETNFYFLYFGFLHQQDTKYFNINFLKSDKTEVKFEIDKMMEAITFADVNNSVEATKEIVAFLKTNLAVIAENAEKIYSQATVLKKKRKNNEEIKYEEIHSFIDDFISFSEEVIKTSDFLLDIKYKIISVDAKKEIDLYTKSTPYFNVAKIANNIMLDLHEKKYSNAIIKAIEIPLSFKVLSEKQTITINNIKNSILYQQELAKIKEIFSTDITNARAVDNVDNIKKQTNSLTFLQLKLGEPENLKLITESLKKLNGYLKSSIPPSDQTIVDEFKNLKKEFKTGYKAVLKHYGIDAIAIANNLKSKLNKNLQNPQVVSYLDDKIEAYSKNIFEHIVLNNAVDIKLESELSEFTKEFISQSIESNSKITDNKAIKLIHFLNDMAVSKDAEDVEKAIDAFALPVGSSSLKEKAKIYASINSFPGILFGVEHSDLETKKDAFAIGFTAPVGFYFHFNNNYKCGVWGLFVPIIDIAAPVRLRLDSNNNTQNLPDFEFKDIFSPGAYLTYGFRKSPFAVNCGIQSGPKLRGISENGAPPKNIDSFRVSLGVVIDIPLLTLSSKYKE